jgi:rare lipoprotein A
VKAGARRAAVSCAALGLASLVIGCAPVAGDPPVASAAAPADRNRSEEAAPAMEQPAIRASGQRQFGDASYYGPQFAGRRMANGRRFDPRSTSVAHRTLPFGTTVLVTNLENGRSVAATVEDRGPFVRGRIIDLSPRLAERLGMIVQGVAPVEVTPVELAEAPD